MRRLRNFIIVLLVIGLLVFGVGYLLKTCGGNSTEEAPSVSSAPYKVTADGRYYFTKNYETGHNYFGDYIILHGYYYLQTDLKWKWAEGDLTLNDRAFKTLSVARREVNE